MVDTTAPASPAGPVEHVGTKLRMLPRRESDSIGVAGWLGSMWTKADVNTSAQAEEALLRRYGPTSPGLMAVASVILSA